MLSHWGMAPFGRIRRVRRSGLVGESVSLGGFEVSSAHTKPSVSLFLLVCGSVCSSQLLLQRYVSPALCHDGNGLNL